MAERIRFGKKAIEVIAHSEKRIRFGKKNVEAIAHPEKGKRAIYRDTKTPHLCLRVTPTNKAFFWEKTIVGRQKRVAIGNFPEINPEQARELAGDISADYVKATSIRRRASSVSSRVS